MGECRYCSLRHPQYGHIDEKRVTYARAGTSSMSRSYDTTPPERPEYIASSRNMKRYQF